MHHSLSPMPKTHPVRTCLLKWYAMEGEFGSEQEIYTLQVLHPACFAWFYWCLPATRRRECCWSLEPHAHHSVVRPTWGRCDSLGDLKKFMYMQCMYLFLYTVNMIIYIHSAKLLWDPVPACTLASWSLSNLEGYEASLPELLCDKGILSPSNFSRVTWRTGPTAGGTLMDMVLNSPPI